MKVMVEINENELIRAAEEMITAAEDLGKKAWRLKSLALSGETYSPSETDGE